jgi:hypothetical protein
MRQTLLTTFTILIYLASFGQENNLIIKAELTKESNIIKDSTFVNWYVLNVKDTFYFPENSTVIQCNYLHSLDRDHNKCRIYINQKLGTGNIEIVRYNISDNSTTSYSGTISNGLYLTGTYITKSFKGFPLLTGQYVNNWKYGFWTSYFSNGKIQSIDKYIEGVNDPVKTWEYNEAGELIEFTDEETEIIKRMKKNNR